jgi:DNA-binding MarR family transcriptional regulator
VSETVARGREVASHPGPAVAAICDELARLGRLMASQGRAAGPATTSQPRDTYLVLREVDRLGPVRQGTLAEALRSDASTVSRQVGVLVKQGLIRRAPDDRDGRVCLLEITANGSTLLDELQQRREARLAVVVGSWTPADQATFADLLSRLVRDISDAPAGSKQSSPGSWPPPVQPIGSEWCPA